MQPRFHTYVRGEMDMCDVILLPPSIPQNPLQVKRESLVLAPDHEKYY